MERDAVPPSSPPRATTADRSTSPFFEPTYNAYSPKSSSPPPLFSSDDSCESVDVANYESPRIFKNKRKGAWWDNGDSSQKSPAIKKAKMTRNYDSGVYMLSDASDSFDSLPSHHQAPFGCDGTTDSTPEEEPLPQQDRMSQEERNFCEALEYGLDRNAEVYDFNSLYLSDADIRRIGELSSVIKSAPDPGNELPAEGQYRSMVPKIRVDLSNNRLSRLTPSLFDVQNLTTLTLTGNNIEELPSQISRLRNLRELHISRNNIKWLPYEFIDLHRPMGHSGVRILGDSGVPWLMPTMAQDLTSITDPLVRQLGCNLSQSITERSDEVDLLTTPEMQALHAALDTSPNRDQLVWRMRSMELQAIFENMQRATGMEPHEREFEEPDYFARTPVSYFDEMGKLIRDSPPLPTSNQDNFAVITETLRGAHGVPSTWFTPPEFKAVKSLSTIALHVALRHLSAADVRDHIDPPPPVADAVLKQAEHNDGGGYGVFKKCHVCRKEYVVARAQWIEWWWPKMRVLPFKVQVCSWACVPDGMRYRPEKELLR
ncbi:hypothetical protein FB567DRAFT_451499 [Paraphoma chrysanthemicola]|uniref:Uncharacterized protein n=1 Tax=Paraphoma chrysanthemicola TaxID=798071 RepID=A0A8K0R085_9PLEO|nr:hypothetical protein FB567DRAFT_451499 [Paraphoma chrysanthemicola]